MADPATLARRLESAWNDRRAIAPFSENGEVETVEDAYAVQREWNRIRVAGGERVVGRKIGLTSPAMQQQMGVSEPDFGVLWESRMFDGDRVPLDGFIEPRVEGELAFLVNTDLSGPGVEPDDVRGAAEAAALAIEIVDSRIEDWRIKLVDTVADNASYGGFVLGEWSSEPLDFDLANVKFELSRNETVVVSEPGSAVLGSPLNSVAWLANKLGSLGSGILAGDIVMSGSFGGAIEVQPDDEFAITTGEINPLSVKFRKLT